MTQPNERILCFVPDLDGLCEYDIDSDTIHVLNKIINRPSQYFEMRDLFKCIKIRHLNIYVDHNSKL